MSDDVRRPGPTKEQLGELKTLRAYELATAKSVKGVVVPKVRYGVEGYVRYDMDEQEVAVMHSLWETPLRAFHLAVYHEDPLKSLEAYKLPQWEERDNCEGIRCWHCSYGKPGGSYGLIKPVDVCHIYTQPGYIWYLVTCADCHHAHYFLRRVRSPWE